MMNPSYKGRALLPMPVIEAARAGDAGAVEQVLRYYEGYINKLCTRTLYDEYGNPYVCLPRIRFHDLRHSAATNMHQLTGDFYTVGEILGHTLAGINASLGLSMNYEAVTARYVDVRFERKKEVLEAYHGALKETASPKREATAPKPPRAPQRKKPMKWSCNGTISL